MCPGDMTVVVFVGRLTISATDTSDNLLILYSMIVKIRGTSSKPCRVFCEISYVSLMRSISSQFLCTFYSLARPFLRFLVSPY